MISLKTAKEYRLESKKALKGNWGMAIVISIVYGLILGVASITFIGGIVLSGALLVGYVFTMMQLFRRGSLDISDLFQGFKTQNFSATIGVYVKTAIFILLWSLLFAIPGIVKAYSYSMAPYILADHPELTGGQAIKASIALMKGKKGKLFGLQFSFIGWILLSALTFGILTLWVAPWMSAANAAFYESIKDEVKIGNEVE